MMHNFLDRDGNPVDVDYEKEEQMLVKKYIPPDASVLELGARYGTVSCIISKVLKDPTQHVAVEPDPSVIEALERNKNVNGGKFHIYNGVVSKYGYNLNFIDSSFKHYEYGTYTTKTDNPTVKNMSLDEIQKTYNIKFDTIVADCEGFFCDFIDENPEILDNVNLLIYEQDGIPWDEMTKKYKKLDKILEDGGFVRVHTLPHPKYDNNPHFHNVWLKKT